MTDTPEMTLDNVMALLVRLRQEAHADGLPILGEECHCARDVVESAIAREAALVADVAELRVALTEIAKGEGAFDREPLNHAYNCLKRMKALATEALAPAAPRVDDGKEVTP